MTLDLVGQPATNAILIESIQEKLKVTRYTFIEDPNKDFEVSYNNRSFSDYKSRDINMNSNNSPPFFTKLTKIMCFMFYTKVRVMTRRSPKTAAIFFSFSLLWLRAYFCVRYWNWFLDNTQRR